MKPPPAAETPSRRLFHQLLRETEESATVALFTDLCRASAALRLWLWDEFARDPKCRQTLADRLQTSETPPVRFADLDGASAAWKTETRRLRKQFAGLSYGGLTFEELTERIVRLQAGQGDAAAFLLALEWRRHQRDSVPSPLLMRSAYEFLSVAMQPGAADLLRQLARAAEVTEEIHDQRRFRAALGFSDWWKLSVLIYMMRHPAPAYRTRDLQQHLAKQGCPVSGRALRQFCTENGITRDMRAGRPAPAAPRAQRRRAPIRAAHNGRR